MTLVIKNAFSIYKKIESDIIPRIGEQVTFLYNNQRIIITITKIVYNEDFTTVELYVNS